MTHGSENRDPAMTRRMLIVLLNIGIMTAVGLIAGCGFLSNSRDHDKGQPMPEQTIEQVQEKHTDEWMDIPGVQGTAIGMSDGKPCIVILSSVKASQLRDRIPETVQGYPVTIKETGTFQALDPE
jgi:hypothetical protein